MTDQQITSRPRRTLRGVVIASTALALLAGGAVLGGTGLVQTTPAFAEAVRVEGVAPFSFADVVERVRPAVVSVRVRTAPAEVALDGDSDETPFFDPPPGSPMERFFRQFRNQNPGDSSQRRRRPSTSLGSGFVISKDGLIVTNNHVIDGQEVVVVILDDGTEFDAQVIGSDKRTDLALLKVDADQDFTYVKFSDTEPRVGDWVVAVGNPFGLGGTVTAGIISAHDRQIGAGPYDDFLQIDAAVNRGNSGGPAFNYRGEVVGVNTAIFSPSGGNVGIAFAIPASTAERIIEDLTDDGSVVRGWLGVQIQSITREIADGLRLEDAGGALVAEVQSGSPAAEMGFRIGDAITAVNGEAVEDSRALAVRVSRMAPGDKAAITLWREGGKMEIEVTLGILPTAEQLASLVSEDPENDAQLAPTSLDGFGLALGAAKEGLGVEITDVDPNGQAAERGLQPGDVILSAGDGEVTVPADVEASIALAREEGLKAILFRIQSGDRTRFVALTLARS
jgi:serine protease Do